MKTLKRIKIEDILFIDIETVPAWRTFEELPDNVAKEWIYKFKFRADAPPITNKHVIDGKVISELVNEVFAQWISEKWEREAGLYAEFSRVVCICAGYIHEGSFRVKSYAGTNEGELLNDFANDLTAFTGLRRDLKLCGHYITGFDIPFLTKRLLINRIDLPILLDNYGAKPWELTHIDTQVIWKFGFGQSATLPSMAMSFGLPSPKDEIDGSDVAEYFFEGKIKDIATYCAKDVVTVMNVFKCLRLEQPFTELQIEYL